MGSPSVISHFGGEHAFLSNFYVGEPLAFMGRKYVSGEHMFQAFKACTKADHERIAATGTPAEARAEGKHLLRLRGDWERVKYDVMRLVLAVKFRHGRAEAPMLLATGDALLIEGTLWGDETWGVNLKTGRSSWMARHEIGDMTWEPGEGWEDGPGRNWLGTLLMVRRAELTYHARDTRGLPAIERSVFEFVKAPPPPAGNAIIA